MLTSIANDVDIIAVGAVVDSHLVPATLLQVHSLVAPDVVHVDLSLVIGVESHAALYFVVHQHTAAAGRK